MSDTTNRDVGRKKSHKKCKKTDGCWLCIPGAEKKRTMLDRMTKRNTSED